MTNKNLQSAESAEMLKLQTQVQELNKAIIDCDAEIDKTEKFLVEIIIIRTMLAKAKRSIEFKLKEATL